MTRRIMHIDLDAFFVSVEQVFQPELKGKPVVVGGKPDRRGVVAAASYEARAFGIHSAMPLITASRLCPQAIFIEGNFSRYRDASQRFMAILAEFTPFLEPVSLDEAYLDVTGFESLHGSIRQMGQAIKQRVKKEQGLCASVGIASSKIVAKVASDASKPDGLLEVPEGGEAAFLAPMAIDKLPGIGEKTRPVLHNLGIHTIGQLALAPLDLLQRRFGTHGELIHRYASGIDNREVEPPRAAKSISRETTFNEDTGDSSFLESTLRYLSERVGADLRRRNRQAGCVSLKLRFADFTTITRQQTVTQSFDTDQVIFESGLKLMKKALSEGKQPVRLIGIGVSGLTEPGRQLSLFDTSTARMEKLNQAIDSIRKKYGFTAIQTGRTIQLLDLLPATKDGYKLHTPGLSR